MKHIRFDEKWNPPLIDRNGIKKKKNSKHTIILFWKKDIINIADKFNSMLIPVLIPYEYISLEYLALAKPNEYICCTI